MMVWSFFIFLVAIWISDSLEFPCNIQRIDFHELELIFQYEQFPSVPVIYTGNPSRQEKMSSLSTFDSLHNDYGHTVVQLSSSNTYSHGRHFMSLSQYLDYIKGDHSLHNLANETLYLFGNNYEGVFQQLSDEYVVPPCRFCKQAGAITVGIGGASSGVSFHFHGPGFSESIIGSKRWFLYPPSLTKTVEKFGANTTVAKWVDQYYPLLNSCSMVNQGNEVCPSINVPTGFTIQEWENMSSQLQECVIYPGEALYFPSQWMHATLNLDEYNVFVSVFLDPQLIR